MIDNSLTVRGETVEKAIAKGLRELNIQEKDAEIRVISEGKKGLFGFGKQDAIVEIQVKDNLSYKELTEVLIQEEKEEQQEIQSPQPTTTPIEPLEEVVVEEPLSHDVTNEVEISTPTEHTVATPSAPESAVKETNETKETDSTGLPLDKSSELVASYIDRVLKEYGAKSETTFDINGNQVTFNIETDKSGLVIGKHGKIINSLQILSQTLLQNYCHHRVSVLLNVGDYRDRRANVLEQIASRTAKEVLSTRQTVILDPLPAYERKQIHAHLAEYDRIKTHSEGKEPNRYLVVEYVDKTQ